MKRICNGTLLVLTCLLLVTCKKGDESTAPSAITANTVPTADLTTFSIDGQLYPADIDASSHSIVASIPQNTSKSSLRFSFATSGGATATLNNTPVTSGNNLVDLSSPSTLKINTTGSQASTSWTITVQKQLEYFGLGSTVNTEKSLDKTYNYYIDQFDGSAYQATNCGPTVTAMAIRWADSTVTPTPVQARNAIRSTGGWWYTTDVDTYLTQYGISHTIVASNDLSATAKSYIDKGNLLILCLDMYIVNANNSASQHTNKFYATTTKEWGHFLLVKGYKVVDNQTYLEIYDPYSQNVTYTQTNELKGKNRYYLASYLKPSVDSWWPYVMVVAPKGKKVITTGIAHPTAIPAASGR
jgi:hypothetical protein